MLSVANQPMKEEEQAPSTLSLCKIVMSVQIYFFATLTYDSRRFQYVGVN